VFLPIFFASKIFELDLLTKTFIGFIIFSFISSCVYIINDYQDIEADKLHPEKKNRPLASGAVSKRNAILTLFFLLIIVVTLLCFFGNIKTIVFISFYFVMNLAYSYRLKHVPIVDVVIIAVGFLLRVLVGGSITEIFVSDWTVILTFTLALILALGKRRGEILNAQLTGKTRKALSGYNREFLDICISLACGITIVFYVMFILSPEVQQKFHHYIFYTFIFVFVGILRYLQQTMVFNKSESPTKLIYKDLFLQMTIVLWGLAFVLLIYFKPS